MGGSDRITLIWADGAIAKKWLQVRVLASSTGLASDDVFYFGNAVGETGNDLLANPNATTVPVNALDTGLVVNNPSGFSTVPITSRFDIDRNGRVNALDTGIVVNNPSGFTPLRVITVPPEPSGALTSLAFAGSGIQGTTETPAISTVAKPSRQARPTTLRESKLFRPGRSMFSDLKIQTVEDDLELDDKANKLLPVA